MTAASLLSGVDNPSPEEAVRHWIAEVKDGMAEGRLAPYLGPGVLQRGGHTEGEVESPVSYDELAEFIGKRVSLPRRARGQVWAAAQYVESSRHRQTLEGLMTAAFEKAVPPQPIHRYLASLSLPLIVDTWYDGAMQRALTGQAPFVQVQGVSRAGIGEGRWYQTYNAQGNPVPPEAAQQAPTVLYCPHGGVVPARNYLISDADYVEVLTEIDIQTPIPKVVQGLRTRLGWVLLGTRFHDQTLRIFARQILKRSNGPVYAVVDPAQGHTNNEAKFLRELGARTITTALPPLLDRLSL